MARTRAAAGAAEAGQPPPKPADWDNMTKIQKKHWHKQGGKWRSILGTREGPCGPRSQRKNEEFSGGFGGNGTGKAANSQGALRALLSLASPSNPRPLAIN